MSITCAALFAGVAGAIATPLAGIAGLAGSDGPSLNAFDAIVYTVYWPNVLLFGQDFQLATARAAAINAVGWSLVGALIALSTRRPPTSN